MLGTVLPPTPPQAGQSFAQLRDSGFETVREKCEFSRASDVEQWVGAFEGLSEMQKKQAICAAVPAARKRARH